MSPDLYFSLCQVRGFTDMNGDTYQKHIILILGDFLWFLWHFWNIPGFTLVISGIFGYWASLWLVSTWFSDWSARFITDLPCQSEMSSSTNADGLDPFKGYKKKQQGILKEFLGGPRAPGGFPLGPQGGSHLDPIGVPLGTQGTPQRTWEPRFYSPGAQN